MTIIEGNEIRINIRNSVIVYNISANLALSFSI